MVHRKRALVKGIVQGIGFRPYVYNLAKQRNLNGYILNTSSGVEIDVEGDLTQLDLFFNDIENNNLPLAQIFSIVQTSLPPQKFENFEIRESLSQETKVTLIPPDSCVCEDCLKEMMDPYNRRYRYPFINCTNCGPRYTIIDDIPYDRPFTSMKSFQMCDACQREYDDPANRRFHAQPNACPACGPMVVLLDSKRQTVLCDDPIFKTIELIKQGFILAIKGLGGFHLAVNAENNEAVIKLRHRKNREEKPLAIMSRNLDQIKRYANIFPEEEKLLSSLQRPIVLLKKKEPSVIAPEVAPNNENIGVMLPYTPLHYLLFDNELLALVMTSANMSEEPIVVDNDEAFERLGNVADYFLIHNRDIYLRSDDSVARIIDKKATIIRRSRGYVPKSIFLHKEFPRILACGPELKNTICLTKGKNAFISQHIGDLKNLESYQFLQLTVKHLKRILDIEPELIAYDLHPDYLSTQYALEQTNIPKVGVQHHHAHIVSCMTEHSLEGPVIGISFDGTGYGTDGKIWGGEILLVEGANFSRLAHFEYTPMPGGDAAIKEPWRMALSYLHQAYGDEFLNFDLPFIKTVGRKKIELILQMIKKNINCPETSSLGRLFDGISAMLGICCRATYEGQPAIMLEQWAIENKSLTTYRFNWQKENGLYKIISATIIKDLVNDLIQRTPPEEISYKFHITLIQLLKELCITLQKESGINRVVLSGGVFQNITLLTGLQNALKNERFFVYSHEKVPTNDGGISLGQAAIAEASL